MQRGAIFSANKSKGNLTTAANHNPVPLGGPRIMSQTGGVGFGSRASMGVMFAISQGGEIHRIPSKGGIIVSASNQ